MATTNIQNTTNPTWLKVGATVNGKHFGKVIIKELHPGHSGEIEYATIANEYGTLLMQLCPIWLLSEMQ